MCLDMIVTLYGRGDLLRMIKVRGIRGRKIELFEIGADVTEFLLK